MEVFVGLSLLISLNLVVCNEPPVSPRMAACLAARDAVEAEGGGRDSLARLKSLCTTAFLTKEGRVFVAVDDNNEGDTRGGGITNDTSSSPRHRRMVTSDPWSHWDKGIIPYEYTYLHDGQEDPQVQRAMRTWERFTCIRFVRWHDGLNSELGLNHQNKVKFQNTGGCFADVGNRHNQGNFISCCGGTVCVHELGHVMGAHHEHENPLGKGLQRMNHQNVRPDRTSDFGYSGGFSTGYDFNSVMKYDSWAFSANHKDTLTWLMKGLPGGVEWYYIMQEVSLVHDCAALHCSHVTLQCVNDGYMTLVDGACACMCPRGLDPSTGCATGLGETGSAESCVGRCGQYDMSLPCQCNDVCDTNQECCPDFHYVCEADAQPDLKWYNSTWPGGQYALPRAVDGCPSDEFVGGTRVHTGAAPADCQDHNVRGCPYWGVKGCLSNPGFMNNECPRLCGQCPNYGNHQSGNHYLAGTTTTDQIEHQFCVKVNNTQTGGKFPAGDYCIFMVGGTCPEGMDAGSATFTDEPSSHVNNSANGTLPDGEFGEDKTTLQFCCSHFGFEQDELNLPPTEPFALLSRHAGKCQRVKGMHAYPGYTGLRNYGGDAKLSGTHPIQDLRKDDDTYRINYCYYVPTVKDCGTVLQLTPTTPTAALSGGPGVEQSCVWLIKGPPGSRIVLDFSSFNLTHDDSVDVHFNRLAQPPLVLQGTSAVTRSISSLWNNMMVTMETHRVGQSYFNATVSLIHEGNLCYNVTDRGHTYRGRVNFTREMEPCVPWRDVAHCAHSPLSDSDLLDGLHDNYCRNPDPVDGVRPWCYTRADGCERNYCDVCRFEKLYDTSASCDTLATKGFCENDPRAENMCKATCEPYLSLPPRPDPAHHVTCSAPSTPPDGAPVSPLSTTYNVGQSVAFTCTQPGVHTVRHSYCLTTGAWTSLNYVCTKCEDGWLLYHNVCVRYVEQDASYPAARSHCASLGALLAMPTTPEYNKYLNSLDPWKGMWIGATDGAHEGHYKWEDGTDVTWAPWKAGQPDNYYNEDCLYIIGNTGQWEDRWCNHANNHPYACSKAPRNTSTLCEDLSDVCVNLYSRDPALCHTQAAFMGRNCRRTCGMCDPGNCTLPPPPDNAAMDGNATHIMHGGQVTYHCHDNATLVSGDSIRGCLSDGNLTGEPLKCIVPNETTTHSTDLKAQGNMGSKYNTDGRAYCGAGVHSEFVIPVVGNISRWDFYSTQEGKGAFQVWRKTGQFNKYIFVGENLVTTPAAMKASLYVAESDRISVQAGDWLGLAFYGTPRMGVGYVKCNGDPDKHFHRGTAGPPYVAGQTYSFTTEQREGCRMYQLRAVIEE